MPLIARAECPAGRHVWRRRELRWFLRRCDVCGALRCIGCAAYDCRHVLEVDGAR